MPSSGDDEASQFVEYEEEIVEDEIVEEEEEIIETVDDDSSVGDEQFLANIQASLQDVFRRRKAQIEVEDTSSLVSPLQSPRPTKSGDSRDEVSYLEVSIAKSSGESIYSYQSFTSVVDEPTADERQNHGRSLSRVVGELNESQTTFLALEESSHASGQSEYEEQVIEKWFGRNEEPRPEDLETACRSLIAIVYKGEDVDPETMIRRTPPLELYRYLHQHYLYKKEVKKEKMDESLEPKKAQQKSLEDLFKDRLALNATTKCQPEDAAEKAAGKESALHEGIALYAAGSPVEESSSMPLGDMESDFHESTFEIEETIHEDEDDLLESDTGPEDTLSSNFHESVIEVEETIRDESDGEEYYDGMPEEGGELSHQQAVFHESTLEVEEETIHEEDDEVIATSHLRSEKYVGDDDSIIEEVIEGDDGGSVVHEDIVEAGCC